MDKPRLHQTAFVRLACLALVALWPAAAGAQDQGGPDGWSRVLKLKSGAVVSVTLTNGSEERGTVLDSSATSLSLSLEQNALRRDLGIGQVQRVRTRNPNAMAYGFLIGAGAGLGVGLPLLMMSDGNEGGIGTAGALAIVGGMGGGVALGFAMGRFKTVYARPAGTAAPPEVRVSPWIVKKGGGLSLAIRF